MENVGLDRKRFKLDVSKLKNGKWIMSNDFALYLSKQVLWFALLISAPIILAAFIMGLLVSILQVVTQVQDSALSFVPKTIAVMLALAFCGDYMLQQLMRFAQGIFIAIPGMIKP